MQYTINWLMQPPATGTFNKSYVCMYVHALLNVHPTIHGCACHHHGDDAIVSKDCIGSNCCHSSISLINIAYDYSEYDPGSQAV